MKRFNCDFDSRFRILKGGKISLVVSALIGSAIIASASPTGGNVTSGTATISQSGNTTNINQSTQKASINWQNFNIASNETVNFKQPNVNSITLNRVVGNERSVIDGALNANGQVWILNSNGILFNSTAKVNTAGIIATTKNISDADFQAGNYKFSGDSTASVVNMGTIEASDNGYVALLANTVQNNGTIKAYKGTVHLIGASEVTINLNGNSIVSLKVNKGVLDALVENKGAVIADGGKIYLTTNAVDEILKGVVNNSGILEANSVDDISGKIEVFAHGGTANVSGVLDASAPISGNGGFIETSGATVNIASGTKITAGSKYGKGGEWLIDPNDYYIDQTAADNIVSVLNSGTSVTIETTVDNPINGSTGSGSGDIFVDCFLAKTAGGDATLTLKAERDINIYNSAFIKSTSNKLNVVLWSDSDADNVGHVSVYGSTIETNGGHFWAGGGTLSGSTWNGLIVGSGAAYGDSGISGVYVDGSSIKTGTGSNYATYGDIYLNGNNTTSSGGTYGVNLSNVAEITGKTVTINGESTSGQGLGINSGSIIYGQDISITGLSHYYGYWGNSGTYFNLATIGDINTQSITINGTSQDGDAVYFDSGNTFTAGYIKVLGAASKDVTATSSNDASGIHVNQTDNIFNAGSRAISNSNYSGLWFDATTSGNAYSLNLNGGSYISDGGQVVLTDVGTAVITSGSNTTRGANFNNVIIGDTHTTGVIIRGISSSSSSTRNSGSGVYLGSTNASTHTSITTSNTGYVKITGAANGNADNIVSNNDYTTVTTGNGIIPGATSYNGLYFASERSAGNIKLGGRYTANNGGGVTFITDEFTSPNYLAAFNSTGILSFSTYTSSKNINVNSNAYSNRLNLDSNLFSGGSSIFSDGFSEIVLGGSGYSGGITVQNVGFLDNLTLYTSGTASSYGPFSVAGIGSTAGTGTLKLLGGGTFNLNANGSNANQVGTLTATNVGNITYRNNGALTLDNISATDIIDISSVNGDITINGNLSSNSTAHGSSSAISINAGADQLAGTSTGGNIVYSSGTITTGTGGGVRLYSGNVSGTSTTGLTTAATYYNSDSTTTLNPTASAGINLIYRETQPVLTTVNYTLSNILSGYAYTGSPYVLSNLWSSASIFGNTYSSWVAGTDYNFVYGASNVSSFTNAGTYAPIQVALTSARTGSYQLGLTNINGIFIIDQASSGGSSSGGSSSGGTTSNPNSEIERTITSIVNNQQIKVDVPKINLPVLDTPKTNVHLSNNVAVKLGLSQDENVNLVSQTVQGQANQVVTLSQLKTQDNNESTDNKKVEVKDVRVALNENSVIEIVNAGVNLPAGVDQEFYVVRQDNNKKEKGAN